MRLGAPAGELRAICDPNVLIAALLSPRGAPAGLVARWLSGDLELLASEALLAELERALAYPKLRTRVTRDEAARVVSMLRQGGVLVADPPDPDRRSADPQDDYLLALAEDSRAVLVTGDRHILKLAGRFPIRTPRELLDSLERAQG